MRRWCRGGRRPKHFPRKPSADEPEWGRAEAWAWLGGTLLVDGKPAEAKSALEHAVADRKDFWWARDIALPQATRSRAVTPGRELVRCSI